MYENFQIGTKNIEKSRFECENESFDRNRVFKNRINFDTKNLSYQAKKHFDF